MITGLKTLQSLNAKTIVPGHGPLASTADVQAVIDYWEYAQTEVYKRSQADMSPLEAARDVLFSPSFRQSPFAQWDSPERLVTSAHTMYHQWGIDFPVLPGKAGPMDLMRKQTSVAFAMPEATPHCMHNF